MKKGICMVVMCFLFVVASAEVLQCSSGTHTASIGVVPEKGGLFLILEGDKVKNEWSRGMWFRLEGKNFVLAQGGNSLSDVRRVSAKRDDGYFVGLDVQKHLLVLKMNENIIFKDNQMKCKYIYGE